MGSVKEETKEDLEADRQRRRQRYSPQTLTPNQRLYFVRRMALYWHTSCYQDALERFKELMVDHYGWTSEEAGRFLGYNNRSIEKEADFLFEWSCERQEVSSE